MQGLVDLFKSERGILGIMLVAAATAMVFTGHLTVDRWEDYTKWIAGFVIAGKTATTVAGLIANRPVAPSSAPSSTSAAVMVNTGDKPAGGA